MKKLVLVALTAMVAMTASGCIITSGDDDPVDEFAAITAEWSIKNIASNDNTLPCPPSAPTTALYNQVIDDNGNLIGQPIIDLFDCEDFRGTATDLDPDIYQTWIELTSNGGGTVYAQSLSAIVDVIDVDKTFTTTILEDGGYFQLDVTLRDSAGGGVLSCSQAGATSIAIDVMLTSSSTPMPLDVPCVDGQHIVSSGLLAGNYVFSISAADSKGPIGDVQSRNLTIADRNGVTDLGSIDLPVD